MQSTVTTYQQGSQPGSNPIPFAVIASPTKEQQENWTLKEKLIYSLVGFVVVGGVIYFGGKYIKGLIAGNEENKTFEDGSSATYAKQIKMAFDNDGWPGTDTTALRATLREIPSKEAFDKIVKSYDKLYNENLLKDMSSELQTTEYNEMLQIINGKPLKKGQALPADAYNAWAKRFKAAFDKGYGPFGGTDGDAIVAILSEIPTHAAFIKVGVAYAKLYAGKNIMTEMKNEGEFGQYDEWIKIITKKPQK